MAARLRLDTLTQIRREAIRVYLQARDGALDSKDMSRLIFALDKIGTMLATERQQAEFDLRLAAIEAGFKPR